MGLQIGPSALRAGRATVAAAAWLAVVGFLCFLFYAGSDIYQQTFLQASVAFSSLR